MKIKSILFAAVILFANSAFAHGVEKIVPDDAHDFKFVEADLSQLETSEIPASDPYGCSDGVPCSGTPVYTTELHVQMTYASKDNTDVPTETDGDYLSNPVPTLDFYFDVTAEQIAAIKAKTLNPETAITWTVAPQQIQIEDPSWQYQCNYDGETNQKIDDGCVEPAVPMITVTRQVLSVSFN